MSGTTATTADSARNTRRSAARRRQDGGRRPAGPASGRVQALQGSGHGPGIESPPDRPTTRSRTRPQSRTSSPVPTPLRDAVSCTAPHQLVPSAKYLAASRSTPRQQEVLSHFGSSAPRSGASIRRQCAAYENRASTARPAALARCWKTWSRPPVWAPARWGRGRDGTAPAVPAGTTGASPGRRETSPPRGPLTGTVHHRTSRLRTTGPPLAKGPDLAKRTGSER